VTDWWYTVRHWPVWALRGPALACVLVVEAIAIAVTIELAGRVPVRQHDLFVFGVLAAGSVLHMELVRSIERLRERRRANKPHTDLKSVWTFAGLLLLPPALSVSLVVLTCLHQRLRLVRMQTFRWVYSSSVVLVATYASMAILDSTMPLGSYPHQLPNSWQGVLIITGAAFMRWFVNSALVVTIILLSAPKTSAQDALGGFNGNLVEIAALCLGAVTALAVVHDPWYLFLILPPLLVLHRNLLLGQYEVAARTDAKTGLANAMHWTEVARTELERAERDGKSVGIIMLDLDHFKRINDSYGHMTGDAVLTTVATALRKEARDYDLIGRFGGEEFLILLPDTQLPDLPGVAERFRHCINGLLVISPDNHQTVTVTASAGVVAYPAGGNDLDELLLAADAALYQAKEAGRNRTCVAPGLVADGIPEVRPGD
jgi:diguanylate cyclase (GGDEF)-like protein